MAYRSGKLLLRNSRTNSLEDCSFKQLKAIQSLPRFMLKWGQECVGESGVERIINATINACNRCVIGDGSLCGHYCFAHLERNGSDTPRLTVPEDYRAENDHLLSMGYDVGLFLSTDTEPLPGDSNNKAMEITNITAKLLRQMIQSPPRGLILHTHTDVAANDQILPILKDLAQATNLIVGMGFQTDFDEMPGDLPNAAFTLKSRINAIETLGNSDIKTQASLSPLLGYRDFEGFAKIFPELGVYRIMIGDLKLDFEKGGTHHAESLINKIGLPVIKQEDAKAYFQTLGYGPDLVGFRDKFYVVLP